MQKKKNAFINEKVINIQFEWNLTCILKTQRTYNPMVIFSKYIVMFIF